MPHLKHMFSTLRRRENSDQAMGDRINDRQAPDAVEVVRRCPGAANGMDKAGRPFWCCGYDQISVNMVSDRMSTASTPQFRNRLAA
jgi:hypothetical protein